MGSRGPKPLMRMMGANRGGKQPIATARPYFGEGSPVTVSSFSLFINGLQLVDLARIDLFSNLNFVS